MLLIDKHFRAYKNLVSKILVKNMELTRLKDNWYNISAVKYDDVKIQGTKQRVDIADQLNDIIELEQDIKATINYKNELKRVHEKEIDKIGDSKKCTILKLYYLEGCSIKQIAVCLENSESHIKKLKKNAISEFIKLNISS